MRWGIAINLPRRIIMINLNTIIQGDCLEVMKKFDDNSIDLTITSPPYDNLRDYNGYTFDFKGIAKELYRVIKEGGVVVWVVGDATIKGSETGTSFRQALYFKEIGFNLHDTMIYEKSTSPFPMHTRCNQLFEYMFIFSKDKPKTFNPIKIPTITGGQKRKNDGGYRQKDGSKHKANYETRKMTKTIGNIWRYRVCGKIDNKHPAIFPEKLAEDHILSWSNEGDIVLDPMAGSGTTLKMAKKNNRNFIGIEISKEYCKIAEAKIK